MARWLPYLNMTATQLLVLQLLQPRRPVTFMAPLLLEMPLSTHLALSEMLA